MRRCSRWTAGTTTLRCSLRSSVYKCDRSFRLSATSRPDRLRLGWRGRDKASKFENTPVRPKRGLNVFFKLASFYAKLKIVLFKFHVKIALAQIRDYVANLRTAFCDEVFQNISSHALRASHGGGSPWVEQTRHAVFLHIHAV